jgi:hypothetical protein
MIILAPEYFLVEKNAGGGGGAWAVTRLSALL